MPNSITSDTHTNLKHTTLVSVNNIQHHKGCVLNSLILQRENDFHRSPTRPRGTARKAQEGKHLCHILSAHYKREKGKTIRVYLTLSLLQRPKVANRKCPVFPKSGQTDQDDFSDCALP